MPEPIESQYIRVGQIAKAHGLDGAVIVIPETNGMSVFESGELVRLQNEKGGLIPARIETSSIRQKNDRRSLLVKFGHITDRNQARQMRKMPVFVSRDKVEREHDHQPLNRLINYTVRDKAGRDRGVVEDVLNNPAHPILVVQTGGKDILVPYVDEYVTDLDEAKEIVCCQKLDQLAEIS